MLVALGSVVYSFTKKYMGMKIDGRFGLNNVVVVAYTVLIIRKHTNDWFLPSVYRINGKCRASEKNSQSMLIYESASGGRSGDASLV